MITVTAQAAEKLKAVAQAELRDPSQSLRLVTDDSGRLALVAGWVREGDQVVEHEGLKVLLIGAEVAEAVDGMIADCEDTSEGPCLTISPPGFQA
jgi:hypothetical protein